MEESINEAEAHQSFKSPPRRRRSTFFERRESLIPQPMSENHVNLYTCNAGSDEDKRQDELTRYYEKLMLEKKQWKQEVKERRNKYNDLKQQYVMAAKASSTSRILYSALTKEDIEFIKLKPNFTKLIEIQTSLHKSTQQIKALLRRITELDNLILTVCEEKNNKITDYILDNSTIMPINAEELY